MGNQRLGIRLQLHTWVTVALCGTLWWITCSESMERILQNSLDQAQVDVDVDEPFNWTIFITPQGFVGPAELTQRRAIMSWLSLNPQPRIVLVGQGERYFEMAEEYGLEMDPNIDLNFVKMPLAGSLIDKALNYKTDVAVILNSDILLTQSFVDALTIAQHNFGDWFMTGARLDIDEIPRHADPARPHEYSEKELVSFARTNGTLHTAGGVDYFVWNNRPGVDCPLFHGHMPPFIRGKSKFDNWFVHEVVQSGLRSTIDGTEAVVAVHVKHSYVSQAGGTVSANNIASGSTFWMSNKKRDWQIFLNNHLSLEYGSYQNQDGTSNHAKHKLAMCMNVDKEFPCVLKRTRPAVCPCEHHSFASKTQNDPSVVAITKSSKTTKVIKCGQISADKQKYEIPTAAASDESAFGLPFTMNQLLPLVARDNHVIVTGVSYNYRDILMNFVCNLRRLGIYDQLIIAAWDVDMYKYGFKMGLPIFLYQSSGISQDGKDMAYGSKNFKKVTKLKSKVVLDILNMGYDVTWTDTDIVWFSNPLPLLAAIPSDFVVQSNAPSDEDDANGPLRINSGFYRIRSTPLTVEALDDIVAHASTSEYTEQPSFYIVLCGGKGGASKLGTDGCVYTGSQVNVEKNVKSESATLYVKFLDRSKYANGATGTLSNRSKRIWDTSNLRENSNKLVILHNNWIAGVSNKLRRFVDNGFWHFDNVKEICSYAADPTYPQNLEEWLKGFE